MPFKYKNTTFDKCITDDPKESSFLDALPLTTGSFWCQDAKNSSNKLNCKKECNMKVLEGVVGGTLASAAVAGVGGIIAMEVGKKQNGDKEQAWRRAGGDGHHHHRRRARRRGVYGDAYSTSPKRASDVTYKARPSSMDSSYTTLTRTEVLNSQARTAAKAPVPAGAAVLPVVSSSGFVAGNEIIIDPHSPDAEVNVIADVQNGDIVLASPLKFAHKVGAVSKMKALDFHGQWSKDGGASCYNIIGDTMMWPSGKNTSIDRISATVFRVHGPTGQVYTARLGVDGKLHWSNGSIMHRIPPSLSKNCPKPPWVLGGLTPAVLPIPSADSGVSPGGSPTTSAVPAEIVVSAVPPAAAAPQGVSTASATRTQ
jgi:hypothetical protein